MNIPDKTSKLTNMRSELFMGEALSWLICVSIKDPRVQPTAIHHKIMDILPILPNMYCALS